MNGDDLLAQDAAHRQRALALESFIVEAPAGAGKTELLTQRYLRLLATVDEPEEIVAITFTNKAAGEMRERIQLALDRARCGEVPEATHKRLTFDLALAALARDAERDWQIKRQPARLRLTTIDALCASLARQMPLLSRFGVQPAIADDTRRHYEEAARRTLAQLDDEASPAAELLTTVLDHLDNDTGRLLDLLAAMLARREQWSVLWQAGIEHPESEISAALQAMVGMQLEQIAAQFSADWQAGLMPLARYAADNLQGTVLSDWSTPITPAPCSLPYWRALADLLLTATGDKRKQVTVANGFPPTDKTRKDQMLAFLAALTDAQVDALRQLRRLPQADAQDDAVVRALVGVLKLASAELWLVFRERGEVDFNELAMRAISALREAALAPDEQAPTELALRMDYSLRHLLVDEFQDTSPAQIELLALLTAGWQPGDGRTLFAVGDPMQSIYRFRKADVGLFLQVAQHGIGALPLTPLRLSRNNRSDPAIVSWINDSFPQVFPARDEPLSGEIRYRPFVATRGASDHAAVVVHALIAADASPTQQQRALEAQRIVDILGDEWRADPARKVAVLVRAREHLQALVVALRRHPAGWRFSAVDVEPLVGRQVVQDLISLTCALHHRADRVHWLAVLRAPWCGLTLADLHGLAGDDHIATIWHLMHEASRLAQLSEDGRQRVLHVRGVMAEALAGQGRQRLRRWVEDVWRKLGGASIGHPQDRADAASFFDRLDVLDTMGRFSPDTLEAEMSALFAQADAASDGRLQLMTIHKSKGLEFDTVILPGLQRVLPDNETPLLIWDSFALPQGEQLVAAPINRRRGRGTIPSSYDFLRDMERQRTRNEDARVLYVAATRAISRLHLIGTAALSGKVEVKEPRSGSFLQRLWPVVQSDFDAALSNYPEALPATDLSDFAPALFRLKVPFVPLRWAATLAPLPPQTEADDTTDRFAAAIGTLVHACLEQMVSPYQPWDAARLNAMEPNLARWLTTRGWPVRQAQLGAREALAMLSVTLDSADGRWVLSTQEDEAAELVMAQLGRDGTAMAASEVLSANPAMGMPFAQIRVVDRCFVADNVRWIIDYKTARWGQAPTDAQLRAHAQRYRTQLETYATLFADEGRLVRYAILYVAYGKLIGFD